MSALGARTGVFNIRTRKVFTLIAARKTTSDAIAPLCQGTEKGVRVLCDYLTVHGFLTEAKETYGIAPYTAAVLDKNSP